MYVVMDVITFVYFRVVIVMKSTVEEGEERLGGKGNSVSMILGTLTLVLMHKLT